MPEVSPGVVLIVGALVVPLLRGRALQAWLVALPILSGAFLVRLFGLPPGAYATYHLFHHEFVTARTDRLSLVFGLVFSVAALLNAIYALHVRDRAQHVAALLYAGSAIGAVFAGDLKTFVIFWETTAITSVFLIWARRTERSYRAGMRYLVYQVLAGVVLLAGILLHVRDGSSFHFGALGTATLGTRLILVAFAVKAAFPLLHTWLTDAYPEATPTGATWLCVFTTKMAVYALARGFAGTDLLVPVGAAMAAFPVVYALVENDLRRVLAYSLLNPIGFMVVGVGLGTPLAIDGVAALAVAHVLYKNLLFMAMGAVLLRTGTARATELGGLRASMPWTSRLCIVGGLSMAAPLSCGFVGKGLLLTAVAEAHAGTTWLVLLLAAAGVFVAAALRLPRDAFFGEPRLECEEASGNMLVAMGAGAALCVLAGAFPQALLGLLPNRSAYEPYDATHVVTQLQLLLFTGLVFAGLVRAGRFPKPARGRLPDADWIDRKLLPAMIRGFVEVGGYLRSRLAGAVRGGLARSGLGLEHTFGPHGPLSRTWTTSATVLWIALILGMFLVVYYLW